VCFLLHTDARTDYVFRGSFRRQDTSSPFQPAINQNHGGNFQRYYQQVPDTESASSLAYAPSSGTISRVQHTQNYGHIPLTGPPRSFQQTVTGPLTPQRSRSILLPNYLSRQTPTSANINQAPALVSNAQDYVYEYSDESEPSDFKNPPHYEELEGGNNDNKSPAAVSSLPASPAASRRPTSLQSLQRPSGRSVATGTGPKGKSNSLPSRPLNALLRPTIPSAQASNNQGTSLGSNSISSTNASSSSASSRRAALAALTKPSKRPAVLRGTNRLTSSTTAKSAEDLLVRSPSSTLRPSPSVFLKSSHRFQPSSSRGSLSSSNSVSSSTPAAASKSKDEDDEYTVEYVEYVDGEDEDGSSKGTSGGGGGDEDKSEYEFIELSEEATKKVLANETLVRHSVAKGKKPDVPVKKTSSTSLSSSSSSSNSGNNNKSKFVSRPNITTSPFSHSEEDDQEDEIGGKGQVVISVATTKSIQKKEEEGDSSNVSEGSSEGTVVQVTPTPTQKVTYSQVTGASVVKSSVQTSRSISNYSPNRRQTTTTTVSSIKATPTTPEVVKDSIPSGAENAPEYYEEEYSYQDNHPNFMNEGNDGGSPSSSTTAASLPEQSSEENAYRKGLESFYKPKNEEQQEPSQENSALNSYEPKEDLTSKQRELTGEDEEENEEIGDEEGDEGNNGSQIEKSEEKKSIEDEEVISKNSTPIQFAEEIPSDLLPPGFTPPPQRVESSTTSTTTTTTTSTTTTTTTPPPPSTTSTSTKPLIKFDEVPLDFLPPGYKKLLESKEPPPPPSVTSAPDSGVVSSTSTSEPSAPRSSFSGLPSSIPLDDISKLLPKGYKPPFRFPSESITSTSTTPPAPPASSTTTTVKSIFPKIKFQEISIGDFLPPDYKAESIPDSSPKVVPVSIFPKELLPLNFSGENSPLAPITINAPANLLPPGFGNNGSPEKEVNGPKIAFPAPEIPANLLPAGFNKLFSGNKGVSNNNISSLTTTTPTPTTTRKSGGVVFPTKPGGFRVTRPTSTEGPKADTPPPPRVTISQGGWPTRKTTEFTGWPTVSTVKSIIPSTTPFVIPTPAETTTTTTKPTTTTTTPAPPPRGEPKVCPRELCRMSATLRITNGVEWKPELGDKNTEEYKHLEVTLKRTVSNG